MNDDEYLDYWRYHRGGMPTITRTALGWSIAHAVDVASWNTTHSTLPDLCNIPPHKRVLPAHLDGVL